MGGGKPRDPTAATAGWIGEPGWTGGYCRPSSPTVKGKSDVSPSAGNRRVWNAVAVRVDGGRMIGEVPRKAK